MAASPSLSLVAESAAVQPASDFVCRGAEEAGLPPGRLPDLALVMEEILMNVVRHAYPAGVQGVVEISYAVPAPGCLQVEIADRGVAFNPLTYPEPDLNASLEDRPVGGLGVFLTRQFTDSLEYLRDGAWNRVRFALMAASSVRASE